MWRFTVVVAVVIMVLGVLNALPQFLGGEPLGVVRYASIGEAEARLGVRLYRPLAMPRPWRWPPSRVRAAVGRADWVEFVFENAAESGKAAGGNVEGAELVICQTVGDSSPDAEVASVLLPSGTLLQDGTLTVAGRAIRMQRMLLDDGAIVHELWWREGARRVMLRGRVPADSLPALASAMVGNR